ncbi:MAG: flagellar biosynthesis protein FlhF [Acidobacteria bacterium]|nr:MAG: flagellar biosynthesis protein FlhF [Acidobacteriota bacterium]
MRVKSYFAPSVEAAMEQARREMGPEALLVSSRKAPPEAQELGEYEVVFAVLPGGAEVQTAPQKSAKPVDVPAEDPVIRELARLRKQMEEMGSALNAQASQWAIPAPEFAETFSRLMQNDFSVDIAKKILKRAHENLESDAPSRTRGKQRFDGESIERAVRAELESLVSVDANLEMLDDRTRVLALVGPPGCGKTTTLVKLAVRHGLACARGVQLITTDTRRVAGVEQLRTYAAILGASFDAVETTRGLEQVLEANREKGLILIDTQGYAAIEMGEAAELAHFLSREERVDVHLVAPASMRSADLGLTIDRYEIFAPSRLIFTRIDETSSWGAIVSESARTRKPVSFLGTGQQIPEDIEPATATRLLEMVLDGRQERSLSAA